MIFKALRRNTCMASNDVFCPLPLATDEFSEALKCFATRRAAAEATRDHRSPKMARVVVVGAGAAGIEAALVLARRGVSVLVLEAQSRVGGRIQTVRVQAEPYDLGATWVHGKSTVENPIMRFANSCELRPPPQFKREQAPRLPVRCVKGDSGEAVDDKIVQRCAKAYQAALEDCESLARGAPIRGVIGGAAAPSDVASAVELLLTNDAISRDLDADCETVSQAFSWREQSECSISGCDSVSELSLAALGEYVEPCGAICAAKRWDKGYAGLIEASHQALTALSAEVLFGHR